MFLSHVHHHATAHHSKTARVIDSFASRAHAPAECAQIFLLATNPDSRLSKFACYEIQAASNCVHGLHLVKLQHQPKGQAPIHVFRRQFQGKAGQSALWSVQSQHQAGTQQVASSAHAELRLPRAAKDHPRAHLRVAEQLRMALQRRLCCLFRSALHLHREFCRVQMCFAESYMCEIPHLQHMKPAWMYVHAVGSGEAE